MGWIEFIFPNKRGIFIGTLPEFDWDQFSEGKYTGTRFFGWVEEWRFAQLNGLYCQRGHIDMKTAEED